MRVKAKVILTLLLLSAVMSLAVIPAAQAQQAQFATPILVANSNFLNIRTGPGVQYTTLVTVVGGTELPVLAVADDRVWYLVSTPVGNGWVNVDYTLPRGDFRNVPLLDPAVPDAPLVLPNTPVTIGLPPETQGQGGGSPATAAPAVVAAGTQRFRATLRNESVNVRVAPSDSAASITTLIRDVTVDFAIVGGTVAEGEDWTQIVVPNIGTGWVQTARIFFRLSACYAPVLTILGDSVGVSAAPGSPATNLPTLTFGEEAFVVGLSPDAQQVLIELPDGRRGYIPFNAQQGRMGTPTDDPANCAGQGGGTTASVGGGSVAVTGVIVPQGQPALELPIAIVNTGFLNIRSGPGAQYTTVATVPGGTSLNVLGIAEDEVWWLVQGTFGQGWVNEEFVLFRGVLDNVPLIRSEIATSGAAIARPVAVISSNVPLYAAPGTAFAQIGAAIGPVEYEIVARTADFAWVQVNTPFGFGWALAAQVTVRGDASVIPIVG